MDNFSEISWSALSETDQMMFSVLSNADRTDMSRVPRVSLRAVEENPRIEELSMEDFANPLTFNDDPLTVERRGDVLPCRVHSPPPDMAPPPNVPILRLTWHRLPTCRFSASHGTASPTCRFPSSHGAPLSRGNKPIGGTREGHLGGASDPRVADEKTVVFQYSHDEDEELQKRSVLIDLQQLGRQDGIVLTREWTMDDRLEDMLLEMRRHTLAQDEKSNVNMMRDGMRLLITGIEMVNHKYGMLDLDGWSTEMCRDLNKHDANLSRIYRKYWRRGTSNSPEVSIAMSLFGSMGMHHLRRTMSKNLMNKAQGGLSSSRGRRVPKYDTDSSDDEAPPARK